MPRTTPRRSARTTPDHGMRTFVHILVNTAVANLATSFLWFSLTFWIYAETRNVIASGAVGAAYMLFVSVCSMLFSTLVDLGFFAVAEASPWRTSARYWLPRAEVADAAVGTGTGASAGFGSGELRFAAIA